MKKKKRVTKTIVLLVVFLLLALLATGYLSWKKNYGNRIYPGITIGKINLGGKTLTEAQEIIAGQSQKIEAEGLKFQYGDKKSDLASSISSFSADSAAPIISFRSEETALNAYNLGRKNFLSYLTFKFRPKKNRSLPALYDLDQDKLKTLVSENFKELEIAPANAYFSFSSTGQLKDNAEKLGKEINYDALMEEAKTNLSNLSNDRITIKTRTKYPEVKQSDLGDIKSEALEVINRGNLNLVFNDKSAGEGGQKKWTITPEELITWASVQKENNRLALSLDQEKIKKYLEEKVAPKIDREITLARFSVNNGKVSSWQSGANGQKLDIEANAGKITKAFLDKKTEVALSVTELINEDLSENDNFRIKEIIGTGHSNFSGSSQNRRHNIKTGAEAANGILIKPGEEFSLVKILGDVSAENGYLPELVIKGNKTMSEYGGGLCQVGTTLFRSALAAGLPITARQNHSYRVSYYEPAGMDAAVYIPQPDVKFLNDTGNYILIQYRMVKNDLYFDFWGVKDGRTITISDPTIYNIVKPAPAKLIETDTLPAGQKKCTEKSHNGADAYFDYKVVYPDETIKEKRFKSHYVPWQEVCLIGAGGKTESNSDTAATSTATSSPTSPPLKPTAASTTAN